MECPVTFKTKKMFRSPNFYIKEDTKKLRGVAWKLLGEHLANIAKCKLGTEDKNDLQYLIRVPNKFNQYHPMGDAAGSLEPLDDPVNQCLISIVRTGCRRIKELRNRTENLFKKKN